MSRPVFGISQPPEEEAPPAPYVIFCDYCGTEPAWWNLKCTAYMLPVGGNDRTYPSALISGGFACKGCARRIGFAVFDAGTRPPEADQRTPMEIRLAAYTDSEQRIKVWK